MAVQSYEIKGGTVQFMATDGKLRSVPSTYVNLAATKEANGGGPPPREAAPRAQEPSPPAPLPPSPSPAASHSGCERSNDRSVVLRITYGKRSLLLMGDAERALEAALLRSGADLRADVLKLAHHGSRSSSTDRFLDAVRPKLAIISARRAPSRPLPSARVLHRLRERGIEYLRTDRNGTVTVRFRGDGEMSVSTYLRGSVFSFRP